MVPVQSTMQVVQPQIVHQIQPVQQQQMMAYVPVQYGPELRGVSSCPPCKPSIFSLAKSQTCAFPLASHHH